MLWLYAGTAIAVATATKSQPAATPRPRDSPLIVPRPPTAWATSTGSPEIGRLAIVLQPVEGSDGILARRSGRRKRCRGYPRHRANDVEFHDAARAVGA